MGVIQRAASAVRGLFAAEKAPPRTRGQVVQDLAIWDQFRRIGGSLTPQQVSTILRNADGGRMEDLCDLANDARQKDLTLQSVLGTRELAVQGLPFELYFPGQDKNSRKGSRQLELCKDVLSNQPDLPKLIGHLVGAVYYGYAVAEIDWVRDGRYLVPECVRPLAPRRFGFRDRDGAFVWRDQQTNWQDVDFQREWPHRFIVSQPRINGDVPCREGLVRPLMWAALFRNWTLSDWLKLGEIAWKPWRVGRFEKKASRDDIEGLVAVLKGMSSSGVAVLPETANVEIQWPGGQVSQRASHSELFAILGDEMAKGVLGQTLTSSQGKVGSQALGNVHNEVRKDIREMDARHVAAVITHYLLRSICWLNFGNVEVPHLRFLTEEAADIQAFGEGLSKLVAPTNGVGMKVPARWAHDRLGIPEPVGDEPVLGVEIEVDTSELDEEGEPAGEAKPEDVDAQPEKDEDDAGDAE